MACIKFLKVMFIFLHINVIHNASFYMAISDKASKSTYKSLEICLPTIQTNFITDQNKVRSDFKNGTKYLK